MTPREVFEQIGIIASGCASTHGDPGGGLEMIHGYAGDGFQSCDEQEARITQLEADVAAARKVLELLVMVGTKATAAGLSVPGEPAWLIEQEGRDGARQWLSSPDNWLANAQAALARIQGDASGSGGVS